MSLVLRRESPEVELELQQFRAHMDDLVQVYDARFLEQPSSGAHLRDPDSSFHPLDTSEDVDKA